MLNKAGDYVLTDVSGINITGNVIPKKQVAGDAGQYPLMREDIAFVLEAARERFYHVGQYWDGESVPKKLKTGCSMLEEVIYLLNEMRDDDGVLVNLEWFGLAGKTVVYVWADDSKLSTDRDFTGNLNSRKDWLSFIGHKWPSFHVNEHVVPRYPSLDTIRRVYADLDKTRYIIIPGVSALSGAVCDGSYKRWDFEYYSRRRDFEDRWSGKEYWSLLNYDSPSGWSYTYNAESRWELQFTMYGGKTYDSGVEAEAQNVVIEIKTKRLKSAFTVILYRAVGYYYVETTGGLDSFDKEYAVFVELEIASTAKDGSQTWSVPNKYFSLQFFKGTVLQKMGLRAPSGGYDEIKMTANVIGNYIVANVDDAFPAEVASTGWKY